MEILDYVAGKTDIPAGADLQRGHLLRAVQPEAAGRAHHLHLPRDGLPHARLAQPAGAPEAATWASGRAKRRAAPTRLSMTTPDRKFHPAHGGLLRPVRAGAGGRGGSRDPRPRERAGARAGSEALEERRTAVMTRITDLSSFQRGPRGGAGEAAAAQAAHRRRHGDLRLGQRRRGCLPRLRRRHRQPRPGLPPGAHWAASASAPKSRWSTSGCRASRW